jgi:N-formylglutamate deformylase
MEQKPWRVVRGDAPLLATALHAGHELRDELVPLLALDTETRLREEDPYVDQWATLLTPNRILPQRSRFEVDLNRVREEAVYKLPDDAWGLHVWHEPLKEEMVQRSLAEYDAFYADLQGLLTDMVNQYGHIVIFDLHSYNHRRNGPLAPPEEPAANPDINLGTGTMDRERWAPIVDRFKTDLSEYNFPGRHLDVRENIKFFGRGFPSWIHSHFPESACVLSVEVKKFFMDEWTGEVNDEIFTAVGKALIHTVPGILAILNRLNKPVPVHG